MVPGPLVDSPSPNHENLARSFRNRIRETFGLLQPEGGSDVKQNVRKPDVFLFLLITTFDQAVRYAKRPSLHAVPVGLNAPLFLCQNI